jgi:hypothetical protein
VALLAEKAVFERKAALVSQLDDPAPLDAAAEQVARLAGDSVSILTLRVDGGTAPSAGDRDGAVNLTSPSVRVLLTGVAASDVDVGIFMGKLALSPLFSHVKLSFTRETRRDGEHTREFEIRFTIRAAEAASIPGPDGSIEVNSP